MKRRNPLAVFFLPIITLGIYTLVWYVSTKGEMNSRGARIPSAWLIIIPFANIYWLWKFSEGVHHVTKGASGTGATFLLLIFLGLIGMAIVQSGLNEVAELAATAPRHAAAQVG